MILAVCLLLQLRLLQCMVGFDNIASSVHTLKELKGFPVSWMQTRLYCRQRLQVLGVSDEKLAKDMLAKGWLNSGLLSLRHNGHRI